MHLRVRTYVDLIYSGVIKPTQDPWLSCMLAVLVSLVGSFFRDPSQEGFCYARPRRIRSRVLRYLGFDSIRSNAQASQSFAARVMLCLHLSFITLCSVRFAETWETLAHYTPDFSTINIYQQTSKQVKAFNKEVQPHTGRLPKNSKNNLYNLQSATFTIQQMVLLVFV